MSWLSYQFFSKTDLVKQNTQRIKFLREVTWAFNAYSGIYLLLPIQARGKQSRGRDTDTKKVLQHSYFSVCLFEYVALESAGNFKETLNMCI